MKRKLIITGITTLALAASAIAENQNDKARGQAKKANRAAVSTSVRPNASANAKGRQFTAHQNRQTRQLTTHQNNSMRAGNRRAVKAQTTDSNVTANRVT